MPYYPKSQIITNLYTNGEELADDNQVTYTGFYYKTSDNRYFTGKNPNDTPNIELFLIPTDEPDTDPELGLEGASSIEQSEYIYPAGYRLSTTLNVSNPAPSQPVSITSLPSEEDYERTEYQRYFLSNAKQISFIEIDENQYQLYLKRDPSVLFRSFIPFNIPWVITGNRNDVYNINKKTTERVVKNFKLRGFEQYFKNQFDQYFRYQPGENLKTDGSEFILESTKRPYSGLYHIHPDKGPMVGAQHVKTPHEYLIPISGSNTQYKVNKSETQMSNQTEGIGYSGGY